MDSRTLKVCEVQECLRILQYPITPMQFLVKLCDNPGTAASYNPGAVSDNPDTVSNTLNTSSDMVQQYLETPV